MNPNQNSLPAEVKAPPLVSVIVAVRDEARTLAGTLDGLLDQDYPRDRFEVLVVDGESRDATVAIAAGYAQRDERVRVLRNPGRWASAGRNVGIGACRGDLVAIVDGHTEVPSRQFLSRLAEVFDRTGADCVGFPQPLTQQTDDPVPRAVAAARASTLGRHPASVSYAASSGFVSPHPGAVAYRRSVLAQLGGFDESFDACEDLELTFRAAVSGFRCYYTAQLSSPHYARASLSALFHQQLRYGRGRVRLLRQHPQTFAIATFLPALLVLGAVATLPLLPLSGTMATAYGLGAAAYLSAITLQAIVLSLRHGWRLLPLLLATFVVIHVGAGVGALVELATVTARRRPVIA